MIRNAILILVAALASATAAASTNSVPTSANQTTPASSLSDVNVFAGAGAVRSQGSHRQYAQAVGDDSKKCKDKDGNAEACPAGYLNGSVVNGSTGVGGASGLSGGAVAGFAALTAIAIAVGVGGNNNHTTGHSLSAP